MLQLLLEVQAACYQKFGFKVDVYCNEDYMGILVVPHGAPLIPPNVIDIVHVS